MLMLHPGFWVVYKQFSIKVGTILKTTIVQNDLQNIEQIRDVIRKDCQLTVLAVAEVVGAVLELIGWSLTVWTWKNLCQKMVPKNL